MHDTCKQPETITYARTYLLKLCAKHNPDKAKELLENEEWMQTQAHYSSKTTLQNIIQEVKSSTLFFDIRLSETDPLT